MTHKTYRPLAFANEFIVKDPAGVEHMKLQKLTYIAYGWWLSAYDEPILDEAPEVWAHGPVFPSLYHALKEFGRMPICNPQRELFNRPAPAILDEDEDTAGLLQWVWDRYGHMTAFELSDLTHEPGSPWAQVAQEFKFKVPRHTPIPDEIIRDHYKGLARALTE